MENRESFNRQKNWQGNIEYACSWDECAQKNHYLLEQIIDKIERNGYNINIQIFEQWGIVYGCRWEKCIISEDRR